MRLLNADGAFASSAGEVVVTSQVTNLYKVSYVAT